MEIDDFGTGHAQASSIPGFFEILDDRHGSGSITITSQFPISSWHDLIGDPLYSQKVTEEKLRPIVNLPEEKQELRLREML